MGDMVKTIFSSFSDVISGLGDGLKTAFSTILYEDPDAAEKVISAPVQFALIFAGVSMAVGLVYTLFKLIRSRH